MQAAVRWVHSSAPLDSLPRELTAGLQSAGMRQVQELVKVMKQVIKDRGVQPTAKLRALKLVVMGMDTQNPALSTCVVRKMLRRLKLMGIQGTREGPAALFAAESSQETAASASFLQLLLSSLKDWSESSAFGEREKQAFQEACRQLQSAGVSFPKRSGASRALNEYRDSGNALMRLLSQRNPDLVSVHEAAEVVRNVMTVLQAEIETRIEVDLSAAVLFEIHDYLQQTLVAYDSWVPTGDPKLPAQVELEPKDWALRLAEPQPLHSPAEEDEDLDAFFNDFEVSYPPEPSSFFVPITQNFEDPIEDDVTQEKLAETVLPI